MAVADIPCHPCLPPFRVLLDPGCTDNHGWSPQWTFERDAQFSGNQEISVKEVGHQLAESFIEHQCNDGAMAYTGNAVEAGAKGEKDMTGASKRPAVCGAFDEGFASPDGVWGVKRNSQQAVFAAFTICDTGKSVDWLEGRIVKETFAPRQIEVFFKSFWHYGLGLGASRSRGC